MPHGTPMYEVRAMARLVAAPWRAIYAIVSQFRAPFVPPSQPSAAEAKRLVSVLHGPVVAHILDAQAACLTLTLALALAPAPAPALALAPAQVQAGREYARSFGQAPRVVAHALDLLEVLVSEG